MEPKIFDVIVIGAGSGGLTCAIGLAQAGKKVALVEGGMIGGDCTNVGCVPSKALIDVSKKQGGSISAQEALHLVREKRKEFRDEETPEWLEGFGIHFFGGIASFINNVKLKVIPTNKYSHFFLQNEQEITAKKIIISSGSHSVRSEIEGVEKRNIITNNEIFELTDELSELVIIGGGYIGCELAESFANLGVKVSLVQRNIQLIPREEIEASELIQKVFEEKGIDVYTNSLVKKGEGGHIYVEDRSTKKTKKIPYSKILIALGRLANTKKLGLENTSVIFSEKGIDVDAYNRTKNKNIFAIGDCVLGNAQFTHWANHEARGVIRNILFPYVKTSVRNVHIPATLYTSIEVARVGKTRIELMEYYNSDDIVTKIMYFDHNDRSRISGDEVGFIKVNFRRLSGKILGASIVGKGAGEMLPVFTSAMNNNISGYKLSSQIFTYPTKSELIKKVADQFTIGTITSIRSELRYFLRDNVLQILTAIVWVTFLVLYFSLKGYYDVTNLELAKKMFQFVSQNTVWGPLIYIALYAIRPIVLFPATLMTLMSGTLFGVFGGFIFTMIGENMSANFAYFLGRVFGKKLLKPESTGIVADLRNKLSGDSFIPILMTRLLFFPFDLVNYSSGILKARWRGFFLGTLIGIIPGALMVIIAGASIKNVSEFDPSTISFEPQMLVYSGIIFIFSIVLAKYLKKR